MNYEKLVNQAWNQPFSGWDFSWADGRWFESEPDWNYRQMVEERIEQCSSLLDMGTGGGEFLSSLVKIPKKTYATEGYPPNLPIAEGALLPKGIKVVPVNDDNLLPFDDEYFDLIINRHESFDISEIWRSLKSDGIFLTQQVGPNDCIEVNQFLEAPNKPKSQDWQISDIINQVKTNGFEVINYQEQYLDSIFYDIGAVILFLKIIEWQIPDFDIELYDHRLKAMHQVIEDKGKFVAKAHRYLIEALKI